MFSLSWKDVKGIQARMRSEREALISGSAEDTLRSPYQAEKQLNEKYSFPDDGGAPIRCRASLVRIVFMKLGGIGTAAALTALVHSGRPDLAESCSWAAAINLIACVNYYFIWAVRAQSFGSKPYSHWMLVAPPDEEVETQEDLTKVALTENKKMQQKLYAQELTVDSFRFSDWTVTLPLMMLDLHKLAEGVSDTAPWVAREVAAFLQTLILFFGSVGRFYTNEMRPNKANKRAFKTGLACNAVSFGIFVFCTLNLLFQTGLPVAIPEGANTTHVPCQALIYKQRDQIAIWVVMLVQVGYPIVAAVSAVYYNRAKKDGEYLSGDYYSASMSLFKDVAYSGLDVTSKGGLAFFCVLRASYLWKIDASAYSTASCS